MTYYSYDYLIVGAGLYGSVFAHEARQAGKRCLVIDRRDHIGGNIYTRNIHNINVHVYGAHIFHTNDKQSWDYVNQFAKFNNYVNSPIAIYKNEVYNLPFNMNTFSRMWNIKSPSEAKRIIASQIAKLGIGKPRNLEEEALNLVGVDIYEKLIKEYTEKQWGRSCKDLPAFIIKRLPCRFTYNNNYYDDIYQGIPIGGYTAIIQKLLDGIEVRLNTEYSAFIKQNRDLAKKTLYTGCIDEFFNYTLGPLQYRSIKFETEELPMENYQGNAVVNYTSRDVPYTRIVEHKHFEFGIQPTTIISREYSAEWSTDKEPYYPINDERNNLLCSRYKNLAEKESKVIFAGRLGDYKYYDMDKVVKLALEMANSELNI